MGVSSKLLKANSISQSGKNAGFKFLGKYRLIVGFSRFKIISVLSKSQEKSSVMVVRCLYVKPTLIIKIKKT